MTTRRTQPPPVPHRVLVSGGTGDLGQGATRELRGHGFEVTVCSRTRPDFLAPDVPWLHADREDAGSVASVIRRVRPTALVDLTSMNGVQAEEVASALHPRTRWVVASTVQVFGDGLAHHRPVETDRPTPTDPYGIGKLEVEATLLARARARGNGAVARLPIVQGPRRGLIRQVTSERGWVMRSINDLPLVVCAGGDQQFQMVTVEQATSQMVHLATEPDSPPILHVTTVPRTWTWFHNTIARMAGARRSRLVSISLEQVRLDVPDNHRCVSYYWRDNVVRSSHVVSSAQRRRPTDLTLMLRSLVARELAQESHGSASSWEDGLIARHG